MAGPSNIRINPFTGTGGATNYVELTEKHIIPAVSPYVIRLNEVPEKQDPSNMKMVYVDSATGAATENTLTEVAATPGQGEFRPDYSTNALEDKTWNTGLIEFSASDAGKIVQVTYTGTGTLAGVNSNNWPSWYTDRGDGSDGDFVPTKNTTISGIKNYKSVFIKSGITVTVNKNAVIKALESVINIGTIKSTGALGGTSGGGNDSNGNAGGAGTISTGGAGGNGGYTSQNNNIGGAGGGRAYFSGISLDDFTMKNICESVGFFGVGAGGGGGGGGTSGMGTGIGGNGGAGGGSICIVCKEFNNKGTISSAGSNGTKGSGGSSLGPGGGGGGGGGAVFICANAIISKGTILVNGGSGGVGNAGGKSGATGGNGFSKVIELGV